MGNTLGFMERARWCSALALFALAASGCSGGGSGDGGGDAEDTGGTDTDGTGDGCASAFPLVPLGYESLAWPSSTPFDADVIGVEGDVANLNSSQTSDFSFRWNEPDLGTLVSAGEVIEVDMDGSSGSFNHWLRTENRLLIAARHQSGFHEPFVVPQLPGSQLDLDIDDGTMVGTCIDELITGEPTYEVYEHAITFTDGQTELTLAAGESGEFTSGNADPLAYLKVYQALSFRNSVCDGDCGGAPDYQRLIFSQRVDF